MRPSPATVSSRVDVLGVCSTVRDDALAAGLTARQAEELSLVVAELGTNAVLHGRGGTIAVTLDRRGWQVEVRDRGPGFTQPVLVDAGRSDRLGPAGVRLAGDGVRSFGSGLAAARRLSTELSLHNEGPGARVVATRRFAGSNTEKNHADQAHPS